MVGRAVDLVVDKEPAQPGAAVLEVRGLTVIDERGAPRRWTGSISRSASARSSPSPASRAMARPRLAEALLSLHPLAAGTISLGSRT